jgi:hypothetical protein
MRAPAGARGAASCARGAASCAGAASLECRRLTLIARKVAFYVMDNIVNMGQLQGSGFCIDYVGMAIAALQGSAARV